MTSDFWEEEESWGSDWRARSTPLLLIVPLELVLNHKYCDFYAPAVPPGAPAFASLEPSPLAPVAQFWRACSELQRKQTETNRGPSVAVCSRSVNRSGRGRTGAPTGDETDWLRWRGRAKGWDMRLKSMPVKCPGCCATVRDNVFGMRLFRQLGFLGGCKDHP